MTADAGGGGFRVVQMTPPGSACSIIFGEGVTSAAPGSLDRLVLVVDDIEKACAELIDRGVNVGEIFHDAGGSLGGSFRGDRAARATGPDPEGRSYASYASFNDPQRQHVDAAGDHGAAPETLTEPQQRNRPHS